MFENGSLLRRRKRFKLHKSDKDILNDELAALANLNRFFFNGPPNGDLPPNATGICAQTPHHMPPRSCSPNSTTDSMSPPPQTFSIDHHQHEDLSRTPITTCDSGQTTLLTSSTITSSGGDTVRRPKRSFTIESLITPDVKKISKKRLPNEDSTESGHQKRSKNSSKSPPVQPLPSISHSGLAQHAQHIHLLDHPAHNMPQGLHHGVDFNFHPHLHPHQFNPAYAAAAAAAAAAVHHQTSLNHLTYDLPMHPLLMMASGPLGHQYFNPHQQQQQQQQQSLYPNPVTALSLQQQMMANAGDFPRIGIPSLRSV